MRMNAVLSNPKHPEYGQFTVPLPIPHNQYDGIMEALNAMDMGDPLALSSRVRRSATTIPT